MTVNCEVGGTFSLAGGDVSSLPEGNIDITASQENMSAVKGETTTTVQKDTTPPTMTITNANTDPAQSKTVSATATDGNITGYAVVPAGTSCDASLTYNTAGASATLSNESDNGNIVCFKAEDALGNASFSASAPIAGIDRTAPVINSADADISGGVNAPVIKFAGQDTGSGIKEWKITVNNGSPTTLDGTATTYTPIGLVGMSHVLKIQAIDHAGNVSEERVLRFPPSVKITSQKTESNEEIKDVEIEITGPEGMKIKEITVSGAGSSVLTCVNTPSATNLVTVPFTCTISGISQSGKLEVTAKSEDDFIGSSEQDYVIDTVNPILTLSSVDAIQQGSDYITKASSTTVIFTATDAGGATANLVTECSLDNGNSWEECTSPYTLQLPTATTTLKIRAKDGTGNLSPEKEITIKKDTQAPDFNPSNLPKIIARKGTAIVIDDVTADDGMEGSGLTPAGVTTNVNTLGLDPANPAPGNYTLLYTAEDKVGNITTANREVEITDADALIAKVAEVTPALLNGKTSASIAAVNQAKQEAEAIIANVTATQAQIDQVLAKLQDAIRNLTNINNSGNNNGNNN